MEAYVRLEVASNGVGVIEFFHPASNSLPGAILNQLAETITACGQDPSVKVLVLRSGGERAFCAGASFDELMAIDNPAQGLEFFSGFAKVINAMRTCPKFVIGRVQGKAVGGGVGLAAAVDVCMATQYASVKPSELAIGIGPFVVGPAVERKMGVASMGALAIDARAWKDAQWASQQGLYAEVFDDVKALDEAVQRLADDLAKSNPEAMAALKQTLWQGTEHWDELLLERAAISGELVLSEFTRNAIRAFKSA